MATPRRWTKLGWRGSCAKTTLASLVWRNDADDFEGVSHGRDAVRAVGVPVVMGGPHVTEVPDEPLGR